jgi:hypothetical protein
MKQNTGEHRNCNDTRAYLRSLRHQGKAVREWIVKAGKRFDDLLRGVAVLLERLQKVRQDEPTESRRPDSGFC